MFGGLGGPEIIIILVIALIIFGPDKLPEMARGIGKGIREFRKITGGVERTLQDEFDTIMKEGDEAKTSPPATPPPTEDQTTKTDTADKEPSEEKADATIDDKAVEAGQ
ncbi:MAG: twin-arginine translocase TatA/TatE family subunit [Actinomycetota bacterium]